MALQYLEALKSLAASNSTTWIVPMELSELQPADRRCHALGAHHARRRERGTGRLGLRSIRRGHGSTRRSMAAWVGRIVAAGAVGYLGIVTVEGSRRIVRPPRKPVEPTEEGAPAHPGDIGLAHEDVRFTTDDGYTLDGWLIPSGRETRATVVLMHGFSWHRLPWLTEFVPWIQPRYQHPAVRLPRPRQLG